MQNDLFFLDTTELYIDVAGGLSMRFRANSTCSRENKKDYIVQQTMLLVVSFALLCLFRL